MHNILLDNGDILNLRQVDHVDRMLIRRRDNVQDNAVANRVREMLVPLVQ